MAVYLQTCTQAPRYTKFRPQVHPSYLACTSRNLDIPAHALQLTIPPPDIRGRPKPAANFNDAAYDCLSSLAESVRAINATLFALSMLTRLHMVDVWMHIAACKLIGLIPYAAHCTEYLGAISVAGPTIMYRQFSWRFIRTSKVISCMYLVFLHWHFSIRISFLHFS